MADSPTLIDKISKAEDTIDRAEQEKLHPLVKAVKILTYPAAAATAWWVGRTEIRKAIYKNFVTSGAFKQLQSDHRGEMLNIFNEAESGIAVKGPALAEAQNNIYRVAVKETFEKAGFHNIIDYWRGMHPNQKTNAIVFATGAAGIVITTSLAIVNSRSLLDRLTVKEPSPAHDK